MLVGLVLGLAIYNAVLLDFPLPLALYRKLIGQSCTLRDLQDMEPTLGKSLTALLQYEGEHICVVVMQHCVLPVSHATALLQYGGEHVLLKLMQHYVVPVLCATATLAMVSGL